MNSQAHIIADAHEMVHYLDNLTSFNEDADWQAPGGACFPLRVPYVLRIAWNT
jgi:hypothetical protein